MTTRFDDETLLALDRAVAAGLAPTRCAVVSAAVRAWLAQHGEEAIEQSYRQRYAEPSPEDEELIRKMAAFSAAACLATNER